MSCRNLSVRIDCSDTFTWFGDRVFHRTGPLRVRFEKCNGTPCRPGRHSKPTAGLLLPQIAEPGIAFEPAWMCLSGLVAGEFINALLDVLFPAGRNRSGWLSA